MSAPIQSSEIVPLADRMRYMQILRLATVLASVVVAREVGDLQHVPLPVFLAGCAGYLGVSLAGELLWRRLRTQGLYLFGVLLIVDGVYLGAVTHLTGGAGSLARYLVLAHLIAVTLLASYRTGLKLALWHSLLMLLAYNLADVGVIPRSFSGTAGAEVRQLAAFITTFWVVAIVTAACSAGNERELRRRKYDLEALAIMARRLETDTTPATVADTLVGSVSDCFQLPKVVLFAGGDRPRVLASRGVRVAELAAPHPRSVVSAVLRRRRMLLIDRLDSSADPELATAFGTAENVLVVPLLADDQAIGVVVAEHGVRHGARASRRVVSTIERFVSHGALALRNAWLKERLQTLARMDELTQVPNRRRFEEVAAEELALALREGRWLGMLVIDIDNFKTLNDTYGHSVGDEVLQGVAAAMASQLRGADVLARFGGEEFTVVLPGCDAERAVAAAERFRAAVAQAPVPVPVTVSIGVAVVPDHGADVASVVRRADEALYQAKRDGRDRVQLAAPLGIGPTPASGSSVPA